MSSLNFNVPFSGQELKASSALRLANSFRKTSTPSRLQDAQNFGKRRSGSHASIEPTRRKSLIGLPLSLIRSKSRTSEDVQEETEQATLQNNLGNIFFAMPNEIQVHILCFLSSSDILSLRVASKPLLELLRLNASTILRVVLQNSSLGDEAIFLERLYPPPKPVEGFDYFLQMMHRETVVLKMVSTISDFVQIKIYQARSASRRKQFAPSRARMEKRLKASTFIIYHFLEKFRADLICHSEASRNNTHDASGEFATCDFDKMQEAIVQHYPEDVVLPAFQFYRVLVSAYRQKLRPPTYAGTIERKLRGWDRTPPGDGDVAHVLIYGGIEQVLEIMSKPAYSDRISALSTAILRVNGRPLPIGSRWTAVRSDPQFIRDLDIITIRNVEFMEAGSDFRLTSLYSPWIRALLAQDIGSQSASAATSDPPPFIPSPFDYIEDLLKDQKTGAIAGGGISVEVFSARADAPDEDEDHAADTAAAGSANTIYDIGPQHRPASFPTQYG